MENKKDLEAEIQAILMPFLAKYETKTDGISVKTKILLQKVTQEIADWVDFKDAVR